MKRVAYWVGAALVLALALSLRLPQLGERPFHPDESVHAEKFRVLWQEGTYKYDPDEFHGPTLYYATLPVIAARGVKTFGDTREADYRLVTVLFGAALVLLPLGLSFKIGRKAALLAALLAALSPAHVYYSRHYIQEMLFVFFAQAVFVCGARYLASRKPGWLVAAGAFAGLMPASKETAVLVFAAAALGLWVAGRGTDLRQRFAKDARWVAVSVVVGLVVASLCLSCFGRNMRGPVDLVRSYAIWTRRGHSTGLHRHPMAYYLETVFWSRREGGAPYTEGFIAVLAVAGMLAVRRRVSPPAPNSGGVDGGAGSPPPPGNGADSLTHDLDSPSIGGREAPGTAAGPSPGTRAVVVFYAVVGFGLLAIYTAIPYKTPWCAVGFLNAMTIPAGYGAAAMLGSRRHLVIRLVVAAVLIAGYLHLARQACSLNFRYATASRNPYAYAQTSPDVQNLANRVEDLAKAHPNGSKMVVQIISDDGYYWPLPWYLRRLENIGYWTEASAADPRIPVVIVSSSMDEPVTKKLDATHLMTGYFGLRPGAIYECFVRMDLWEQYLKTRPKPKEEPIDPKYE